MLHDTVSSYWIYILCSLNWRSRAQASIFSRWSVLSGARFGDGAQKCSQAAMSNCWAVFMPLGQSPLRLATSDSHCTFFRAKSFCSHHSVHRNNVCTNAITYFTVSFEIQLRTSIIFCNNSAMRLVKMVLGWILDECGVYSSVLSGDARASSNRLSRQPEQA